jgi:hypothetical protein
MSYPLNDRRPLLVNEMLVERLEDFVQVQVDAIVLIRLAFHVLSMHPNGFIFLKHELVKLWVEKLAILNLYHKAILFNKLHCSMNWL